MEKDKMAWIFSPYIGSVLGVENTAVNKKKSFPRRSL